ncbi:MAG: hypothetical protein KIS73_27435 [Enhydrobacter sp.]|nr:hypothetical protein [Enhydrobacter sp.]
MKVRWIGNLGLTFGAVVLTLGALEVGLRLAHGGWIASWPNFILESRRAQATQNESRHVEDPTLGYVPRPNYSSNGVNIDTDGLRRTGTPGEGAILAVGDSFTFGDEVSDEQTWPVQLQRLLGRPVLNGGVVGYGLDQIVLRAERIVAEKKPSVVVVSFIADDVLRTEMRRRWSAEKPYFDIVDGALVLRNVPVPKPDPKSGLGLLDRTLGYSFLVQFVMRRLDLWNDWQGDHVRVHRPGTGETIACLLTRRLADLQRSSGARVLVVAQYDPYVWQDAGFAAEQRRLTNAVLACSRQQGLDVLDTFDAIAANGGKGAPKSLYREWHMNEAGNRLTAELIAAEVAKLHIPPR